MAQLKNIGGYDLDLFALPGEIESFPVAADATVTVPGEVQNADDPSADHYLIGTGDAARAWPKSTWSLQSATSHAPPTASPAVTTGKGA